MTLKWLRLTETTSALRVPGGMVLRDRYPVGPDDAVALVFVPHPATRDALGKTLGKLDPGPGIDGWLKEHTT